MPPVDQAERTERRDSVLPPPVRAGIGLVAAGMERAKHLPKGIPGGISGLSTLPLRGLAFVATARETVERTYEELTNRGETIVARWRHRPEPRQTATPPAPEAEERVPDVAEVVEPFGLSDEVVEAVEEATPGATLTHDQLPLEDFDHLTIGQLRSRLVRLDPVALVQLRDYERAHAHRLPVLTMIENRIAKVANG
ncbi:MAG TPA: hypothetical protein VFQ85_02575 [Mycobacteriales bacterium]|jgi:hypothetical protein|nr:hypothetical protein [Mycobacteriales bacterium]